METLPIKLDSTGRANVASAGAFGLVFLPTLPHPDEIIYTDRPGAFPIRARLESGPLLTLHNGEGLYRKEGDPFPNLSLEGGRVNEWWRVVTLGRGEVYQPGQGRVRRTFPLFDGSLDFGTGTPPAASDGYEIRPGWVGLNLLLVPSSNTLTLWFWDGAAFGWRASETFTDAGWYYRAIDYPGGRVAVTADVSGGSWGASAVAEVS